MRSLLTLLALLLISASAAAQEATPETSPEGWEVVQRCITAPSEPPEGWTFEGTIFTYRSDGIRGFKADVSSPYLIAFQSDNEFGGAGTFSPDGRWYALPRGHTGVTSMLWNPYHVIETLRVISTAPNRIIYDIPWSHYEGTGHIEFLTRPRWLDNEILEYKDVYGWHTVEPFQNPVPVNDSPSSLTRFLLANSPDASRAVYRLDDNDFTSPDQWILLNEDTQEEIVDFTIQTPLLRLWATTDFGIPLVGWLPDSTGFIAMLQSEEQDEIVLFSRDGNFLESLFSYNRGGLTFRVAQNGLSAAFVSFEPRTLHLIDLSAREIVDTCIQPSFREFAVSPDGRQVALSIGQDGFVYILDIEDWAVYRLDLAAADVIAWFPSA